MFFISILKSETRYAYNNIDCIGSKYACNMLIRRSKWLTNSKALYFSESVEFEKVYVRFLLTLTWVWLGHFTPPPPPLPGWFSLNKSETAKAAAFTSISLETYVPNLISLTRPSLQTWGKLTRGVFSISGFQVNPL